MPSVFGTERLAGVAGLLTDFFEKLAGPSGTSWMEEFEKFLQKKPTWVHRLLEPVATVGVSGAKRFAATDHFVVGKAGITWLGDNFKSLFGNKVETSVQLATLRVHRLTEASLDAPIRAELGADREETTLAHLFGLLEKQADGGAGPLLTNGYANIFYIRDAGDAGGKFWAVNANRNSDGWNVNANSVENPNRWNAGNQVVSRYSFLSPPLP